MATFEEDSHVGPGDVELESPEKSRSVHEKKRRNDTNLMLNNIETLVYSSKPVELPSKKVGKIQILEKTCSFIRFYTKLVKNIEDTKLSDSVIPCDVLQDLLTYSQKGFLLVVGSSGHVICCSSSTMGCLQSQDTMIVGAKLSQLLTINDNDYIMSLINDKKGETMPFYLHFTFGSAELMRTFSCRAFWHLFSENLTDPDEPELSMGAGALILACSSIDKLSMYCLPIFNSEHTLNFEFKVSLDGKFTKIDSRMERYTGYSPAELIGRCILDYVNWEQTVELMDTMSLSLKKGTNAAGCLQFCCKSKSWIWIQADIRVLQNVWNSRVDSLVFACKALDYNEVIAFLTQMGVPTADVNPPHAVIEDILVPTDPHMPPLVPPL